MPREPLLCALYGLNHACNCGRKKNHALGCPKAKRPRLSGMSVTVFGVPQPAGSKIAGQAKSGRLFVRDDSKGSAPWKRQVSQAAGEAMNGRECMDGPLELVCRFYMPRPQGHYGANGLRPSAPAWPTKRPDTTKLVRAVEDALTGIAWRDDAQVVTQYAAKLFGEPARVEIVVRPLAP